jgi:hypothetical protein
MRPPLIPVCKSLFLREELFKLLRRQRFAHVKPLPGQADYEGLSGGCPEKAFLEYTIK